MAEKIVKDSQGLAKELVNGVKEFEELKVIDLNGRPYYSIIYLENGNEFEGYASYNLKVISEYLKRHFGFAQPETRDKRTEKHACDCISRQAAIDAINEIINRFERILQGIRESKVDDSVCGMCEYDGAYIGQSGDWCNECPGFEKNNCFKLSDKCRTRWLKSVELPSAQPEQRYTEEELRVFKHGISLSLLSKRSSQHWQYDEDTATEIKFLERLYEKVSADMRGAE